MNIQTIGTILYWCEGSKRERDRRVEFVNSDSSMVLLFMKYLRTKNIDEKRLRARMMLHETDDESECKNYWRNITGINESCFLPSVIFTRGNGKHLNRLPHGTLTIRYNSLKLLREINTDIEKFKHMGL